MSPKSFPAPGLIGFAAFELDSRSGVLRKHGIRIRLQDQPFRVLLALVERPGELVTRDELREKLWPNAAFGEFDRGLNLAVNKLREALGDSAATPRFVETMPRRGYRFIAPVVGSVEPAKVPVQIVVPGTEHQAKWIPVAGAAVVIVLTVAICNRLLPTGPPPQLEIHRLTNDSSAKLGPVLSDSARLYFQVGSQFDSYIAQLPPSGGEPLRLPVVLPPGRYINLLDITPDRQELLLGASDRPVWTPHRPESAPLWTVRIAGASVRRIGAIVAHDARYSPDGRRIAYTIVGQHMPGTLWVASGDGSNPRRVVEAKGMDIIAPFWSPDGQRIAFGERNQKNQFQTAWEVSAAGGQVRPLLPDKHLPSVPAGWAPDGRLLITSGGRLSVTSPRHFFPTGPVAPLPISPGEPRFYNLAKSEDNSRFYAIGTTPLGQLQRFDVRRGNWEPHLGGISADMAEYSKDGRFIAYSTYPEHELWVRRADGSRPVQLTRLPMQALLPRWSPDGAQIAFLGAAAPEEPMRIYIIGATGGTPSPACRQDCGAEGDLTWSPDAQRIVCDAEPRSLWTINLATGRTVRFPEGEGLYSPHWSPDGSMMMAMDGNSTSSRLKLYRGSDGKWMQTAEIDGFIKWPFWSRDSKFIWYFDAPRGMIAKYAVLADRHEDVSPLNAEEMTGTIGTYLALTPNDEPMILRRRDIQQVYALDWKPR